MARNTRQQRRARRREAAASSEQAAQAPAAGRARAQQRPATAAPREHVAHREPRQRFRFIRESWAELNKVEWPNRNQVLTGSVVVIIACAIVGAYLWVVDLGLQRLVERVLL